MWAKLGAGAGILALAVLFAWLYGNARYDSGRKDERIAQHVVAAEEALVVHERELANERRGAAALVAQAERYAAREPIILTSHETVTRYAETAAGRAPCLSAERVSGLDAFDATLFPPPAAARIGAGALSANAGATPSGR